MMKNNLLSDKLDYDAWADSTNYLVNVSSRDTHNYVPKSIDTSMVELPSELLELAEALAKNVHEVWAKSRLEQGWLYGVP